MQSNSENYEAAQRLRAARKHAGYKTAKSFIRQYGLHPAAYYHHENGTRKISIEIAKKYAKLLHIDPGWLLIGTGKLEIDLEKSILTQAPGLKQNALRGDSNSINQNHALIHHDLFMTIANKILKELYPNPPLTLATWKYILQHSINIYNDIIISTTDKKQWDSMITIALSTLKRMYGKKRKAG